MIKNGENREEEEKKKVGRNSDRKKSVIIHKCETEF